MATWDPQRLGNQLHDETIQELSALVLQLETCQRRMKTDPDAAYAEMDRIKRQARDTLQHLRKLVTELRSMNGSDPGSHA